jgi:hypothetical protein
MPFADERDLRTALRAATLIARYEIERYNLRPLYELYRLGMVRYRWPEVCNAPGVPGACERFLSPRQALIEGGNVDCDDVAPWRAGELQLRGVPAEAIPIEAPQIGWHCVVESGSGLTEDPSKVLGMR